MSTSLSTQYMVDELQRRIPIGLTSAMCMQRLNDAFRWVDQHGPTVWRLAVTGLTLAPNASNAPLPPDFDPTKGVWISGGAGWKINIPYLAWDKFQQQATSGGSPISTPGMFGCWTWTADPIAPGHYVAYFAPASAIAPGGVTLGLAYHQVVPQTSTTPNSSTYYPTPDQYDTMIIDIAESEIKRIYSIDGWDMVAKKSQAALERLAATSRSSRETVNAIMEQGYRTQERGLARQE